MPNRPSPLTMESWNKDWIIHGHKLACRCCGAKQCPTVDERPFVHTEACSRSQVEPRYPWKELQELLRADLAKTRRLLH